MREDGLDMVLAHAGKLEGRKASSKVLAEPAGVAFGTEEQAAFVPVTGIPKEHLLESVAKFRYYLQRVERIDAIFEKSP